MKNAKFTDSSHSVFSVEVEETIAAVDSEGQPTGETATRTIVQSGPASEDNPVYVKMLAEGLEISDYVAPPQPFEDVPSAAFWAAAKVLLGMTRDDALALAAAMPEATQDDQLKKETVINVINGDGKMRHNNPTMEALVEAKGLTTEQFDQAWRVAEGIEW